MKIQTPPSIQLSGCYCCPTNLPPDLYQEGDLYAFACARCADFRDWKPTPELAAEEWDKPPRLRRAEKAVEENPTPAANVILTLTRDACSTDITGAPRGQTLYNRGFRAGLELALKEMLEAGLK